MSHSAQSTKSGICTVLDIVAERSSFNHSTTEAHVGRELEIIAAAQAGSTTAFDEIQRLYASRLFKTIFRITRNREDAEDALQDTFLSAYMGLRGFESRSSVYSWLTRIAVNSALMILRKRRSRPEAPFICSFEEGDGHLPLDIKDSASNPEDLCDLSQRRKHLSDAIRKLEPGLRGPIEIQLAGDYSLKDIASALNISVAAVKARLYRARTRLATRVSMNSRAKDICRCA
jgi:RNA polymerase sigma-70 factor, ECF subfamily